MEAIGVTVGAGIILALTVWIGSLIKAGGKKVINAVKHSETGEGCPYSKDIAKLVSSFDELNDTVKDMWRDSMKNNEITNDKIDLLTIKTGAMHFALSDGNGMEEKMNKEEKRLTVICNEQRKANKQETLYYKYND